MEWPWVKHGSPVPGPPRGRQERSEFRGRTETGDCLGKWGDLVLGLGILTSDVVPSQSAISTSFLRRHRWKLVLFGFIVAAAGLMALWTAITLSFNYSDGDRIGYVQKFSHKGWICQTWEGELAMSPVPGSAPQIFLFTVRDDAVAKRLTAAEGKKVALHYAEKRGVPSSCFGETSYFVNDVRVLGP